MILVTILNQKGQPSPIRSPVPIAPISHMTEPASFSRMLYSLADSPAQYFPGAAQLQVLFGDIEAVGTLAQGRQARLAPRGQG